MEQTANIEEFRRRRKESRIGKVATSAADTVVEVAGTIEDATRLVRKTAQVANAMLDPIIFDARGESAMVLAENIRALESMGYSQEAARKFILGK